jgi:hypothetical protein
MAAKTALFGALVPVTSLPEPGSLTIFGAGLAALALFRCRNPAQPPLAQRERVIEGMRKAGVPEG